VRRSTVLVVAIAAIVVAGIALAILRSSHTTTPDDAGAQTPKIPTVAARYGTIDRTIAVSGRAGASSASGAKLAFGIAGTIERVDVAIGDRVSRGQELAHLDVRPYEFAAQQAQAQAAAQSAAATAASVDKTSARLRADEANLSRQRTLFAAGIVARKDVQAAAAAVASDRADARIAGDQSAQAVAQASGATSQAQSARYDLERTSLRAPYDGTISEVATVNGETVDAATPVLSVVPDGEQTGTLDVSFAQAGALHLGDLLALRAGDVTWIARVAAIAPAIRSDSGLTTVRVSNVPANVSPGTPIDGTATVGTSRGLLVPAAAIVEDPESGDTLVFVRASDGKFNVRHVTIDGRNENWVRIVSGLRIGERVAAQGAIDLLQQ
jgi:RND family efflux transporter MFP subunit